MRHHAFARSRSPHPSPLPKGEGARNSPLSPRERVGVRARSGSAAVNSSLSLWERAGVRAASPAVRLLRPHPHPRPVEHAHSGEEKSEHHEIEYGQRDLNPAEDGPGQRQPAAGRV